jgi:hypothetical protein
MVISTGLECLHLVLHFAHGVSGIIQARVNTVSILMEVLFTYSFYNAGNLKGVVKVIVDCSESSFYRASLISKVFICMPFLTQVSAHASPCIPTGTLLSSSTHFSIVVLSLLNHVDSFKSVVEA